MPEAANNPALSQTDEVPPEIVMIPTGNLYVPGWNPRQFIDPYELQRLIDYRGKGGKVGPILVWKGNGQAPLAIISGQRRWQADKRLGKTRIAAIILDNTLEDAKILAIASNTDNKPHWLGEFIAVENLFLENQLLQQAELAVKLGWTEKRVSQAIALTDLFNQAVRDQISLIFQQVITSRNSISKNKGNIENSIQPWQLTEGVAVRLIPLLDNPSRKAAQDQAEKMVQILIDRQLTISQTDDLVAHTLAGNDPAQFEPVAKVRKARSESSKKTSPVETSNPDVSPVSGQSAQAPQHVASAQTQIPTAPLVKAADNGSAPEMGAGVPSSSSGTGTTKASAPPVGDRSAGGLSAGETLAWDFLAGISPIKKIKAKINKGERPTWGEALLLGAHDLGKPLGKGLAWVGKHGIKGIFHGIHWIWKTLIESLKAVGLYPWVQGAFYILLFLLAGWCVWDGYHNGFWHPVKVVGTKLHLPFLNTKESASQTNSSMGLGQPSLVARHEASQQVPVSHTVHEAVPKVPAVASVQMKPWSEDQESKTDLDFEIAAVKADTQIRSFAFEPNYLEGAIAGQRLQDLQDPDKYTLRRGRETDKVLNVSLLSTNLIVSFKSSDALGGLVDGIAGGSNKASFYWEDVKTIHVNQLVSSAVTLYQCGVIADGMKEPFTVQCPRAEDLKHLVSALEFWIKTAQGKYAPLTGMPYPNQGLVLNNDCVVDKLWAGSPAWNAVSDIETAQPNPVAQLGASQQVKAGVALGDHLWSIGKVTPEKQERNDLETGLQSAPVTFFAVSPDEWNKALAARNHNQGNSFRPKLRKVVLSP